MPATATHSFVSGGPRLSEATGGLGSDRTRAGSVGGSGLMRRVGLRLAWVVACGVVLSLVALIALLPTSNPALPNIMWRGLGASPSILPKCPVIDYSEPSCLPASLHAPSPNITDAQVFENMYRGFKCLAKTIVDPWTSSEAARPRPFFRRASAGHGGRRVRCGGNGAGREAPSPFTTTQEEAWENGWRAMAEAQLCTIIEPMYEVMLSCRHSLRRGMPVKSGGELLARLSNERSCPPGLAVCAVVKNEAAYIQEWLAFHIHSGVQHFYLYLNDDSEGTAAALRPFIDAGFVTLETIRGQGIQGQAYDHCLQQVKRRRLAEWIGFFDVEEYLFLGDHGCLMDYLHQLDDRAALTVNWRTYSLSNQILQTPPDRLMIESNVYTRADEEGIGMDQHIKSIVHVNRTAACRHPHFCEYRGKWSAKDEWGHAIDGPFNQYYPRKRHVHLNHYITRSHADFLMKCLRGRADANGEFEIDYVTSFLGPTARMALQREDIKPAVVPVRRILGLD